MDTTTLLLVIALGFAVLAVRSWKEWLRFHTDKTWNAKDVLDDFSDALKVIQKVAPAADQLVALKELPEAKRREYVVDAVAKLLPNLDPEIVKSLVEYWVVTEKPELKKTPENLNPTPTT